MSSLFEEAAGKANGSSLVGESGADPLVYLGTMDSDGRSEYTFNSDNGCLTIKSFVLLLAAISIQAFQQNPIFERLGILLEWVESHFVDG